MIHSQEGITSDSIPPSIISQQVLSYIPRKKQSKKIYTYLIWATAIICLSCSIIGIVVYTSDPFYESNPGDAFSHAAGFALSEMAGNYVHRYSCGDNPSDNRDPYYFYEINVEKLSEDVYYVIGATKAINQYCLYDVSYFVATVYYLPEEKSWELKDEVFFSNSCVTIYPKYGECVLTKWRYDWKPDYSWRP